MCAARHFLQCMDGCHVPQSIPPYRQSFHAAAHQRVRVRTGPRPLQSGPDRARVEVQSHPGALAGADGHRQTADVDMGCVECVCVCVCVLTRTPSTAHSPPHSHALQLQAKKATRKCTFAHSTPRKCPLSCLLQHTTTIASGGAGKRGSFQNGKGTFQIERALSKTERALSNMEMAFSNTERALSTTERVLSYLKSTLLYTPPPS